VKLNNPNGLFNYGSLNGGAWRCAYQFDSIGEASVFVYFGRVANIIMYLELPLLEQLLGTDGTTVPLRNRCTLSFNTIREQKAKHTQQRGKNSREMKDDAGDNKIVGKFCMES